MLHELLLALSGESGSIFVKKSKNGFQVAADLPFTHRSEVALLNRICRLGSQYLQLQIFINKYVDVTPSLKVKFGNGKATNDDDVPFGLYIQAFCTGLDQVLQAYRNELVSLENQVLKDPCLPLSFIEHKLEEYQFIFPALLSVIEEINTTNASGCQILEILFKSCICGVPGVKVAMERILHVCHGVMYQQLSAWLLHGLLTDNHGEFFVTEITDKDGIDSPQKSAESSTDLGIPGITGRQLAEIMEGEIKEEKPVYSKYRLNTDMLPSYIMPRVADKILFIGESVKMFEGSQGRSLSRSQNSVLHDHEEMFIRSLFELQKRPVFSQLAFESEIDKIRTCVAKHLWTLVVVEADLLQHLKIIKGFFLLGRGELFSAFIEASRSLLKLPPTTTTSHDASALFQQVLHKFVPDDDEYSSLFNLTVAVPSDDSKKKKGSSDQIVVCGWDCVKLEYTVKWPLHIIFQDSALDKYNSLFHYLLNVKRTQLDLQQVWAAYMANKNSHHIVHKTKLWLLRMHMAFLVDNLQYYLQVDVLEAQYTQLLEKIKNTRDFESIRLAHDHFLTTLMAQSFLLMKPVCHCLVEILNLCKSFCALLLQVTSELSEREEVQIDSISKSYERQSSLLFKILSSVSSHQASPHLAQLLLRIDFNKHFSSRGYERNLSGDRGDSTS